MGLSDEVVILDGVRLTCPEGHVIGSFQTKDLERPTMATYLVHGARLYQAVHSEPLSDADVVACWRIVGSVAVREFRYTLREVPSPCTVRVYGHCDACAPVLVRTERAHLDDLVREHTVHVDYTLRFRTGESVIAHRDSGTRDELRADLRHRGLHVLDDDEPLAVAHREIERARARRSRADWP